MNDYAKMFKAFVCPYLACIFGSGIGFNLTTGQDVHPLLWALFVGVLTEIGIEVKAWKLKRQ